MSILLQFNLGSNSTHYFLISFLFLNSSFVSYFSLSPLMINPFYLSPHLCLSTLFLIAVSALHHSVFLLSYHLSVIGNPSICCLLSSAIFLFSSLSHRSISVSLPSFVVHRSHVFKACRCQRHFTCNASIAQAHVHTLTPLQCKIYADGISADGCIDRQQNSHGRNVSPLSLSHG